MFRLCLTKLASLQVEVYQPTIALYSRAIVGWYTSTCKDASFVKQSRNMALRLRDHTDWPVRTAPSATSRPSR